ncbi:SUKH-3 domain-containing protein [Streptomyces sp. NPDC059708]|uniref:SUKH-3 domain-containing protein n=1 Tax=Streptomyces sp. NPDC059708 TaxID=3346916 RepID=UPI003697E78C
MRPGEETCREAARAVLRAAGWTPGRGSGPGPAPDTVERYGPAPRAAGEPVYPVGEFARGNCVLLVGESGGLYGAFDAVLGRLGPDALTGLGRLVADRSPLEPRLPVPPEALYRPERPARRPRNRP